MAVNRRRTTLLAISTGVIATLTLASCASSQENETSDAGGDAQSVTLRVAAPSTSFGVPFEELLKEYGELNPNVTIQYEVTPPDKHGDTLITQLQAGNAADVFYVSAGRGATESLLPFAEAGYLEPVPSAESVIPEESIGLFEVDGVIYGQPVDQVAITNNINADALEEAGLEIPETIDDLLDNCAAAVDQGKSWLTISGSAIPNTAIFAAVVSASTVYAKDPDWNEQREAGDVTFATSREWQKVFDLMSEMNDAGCFQPGVAGGTAPDNIQRVATGQAIGSTNPAGTLSDLAAANPEGTFIAAAFPGESADDTRVFATPTNAVAINAKSGEAEKAAAAKLFEWLGSPEIVDQFSEMTGNLSLNAVGGELPERFSPLQQYFDDSKVLPLMYTNWPNAEVRNAMGAGVQGILTGQATTKQVLESLDTAWDR